MPKPLVMLEDVIARHKAAIAMSREHALEMRRPGGVDKARFGMAVTKAAREPMLNAHPQSITKGLLYKEPRRKDRQAKGTLFKRIIVKPTCLQTARYKCPGGYWGERAWCVYTLKYSPGFVIVTDHGDETPKFDNYGSLRRAIKLSGWELLRSA